MSTSPVDSGRWHLELERTVQPPDGAPGELENPNDIALADDGTLLVVDEKPRIVKVFDGNGTWVRNIGRDGEGPGEYRTGYIAVHSDTLFVQDPRLARASTFRIADGTFIVSTPSPRFFFHSVGIDGAGRGVMWMMTQRPIDPAQDSTPPAQRFMRVSLDGKTVDTVDVTERRRVNGARWAVMDENKRLSFTMTVPLLPLDVHAVDPLGGFVSGWSGNYVLRTTRNGSDTVAVFGRTYQPEPVTAAQKAALVEQAIKTVGTEDASEITLRAAFDVAAIPDQRPAFGTIAVDRSGRRWVRRSTSDTTAVRFDLFARDGRWLDVVTVPANSWPPDTYTANSWSKDHVAVLLEDESGRPMVKVYRIVRKA